MPALKNILIVGPENAVAPRAEPLFRQRNWTSLTTPNRGNGLALAAQDTPDVIVIHGDRTAGEAARLGQRFTSNALTSGIPLILVEDSPPPAWLLAGMAVDAVTESP